MSRGLDDDRGDTRADGWSRAPSRDLGTRDPDHRSWSLPDGRFSLPASLDRQSVCAAAGRGQPTAACHERIRKEPSCRLREIERAHKAQRHLDNPRASRRHRVGPQRTTFEVPVARQDWRGWHTPLPEGLGGSVQRGASASPPHDAAGRHRLQAESVTECRQPCWRMRHCSNSRGSGMKTTCLGRPTG